MECWHDLGDGDSSSIADSALGGTGVKSWILK